MQAKARRRLRRLAFVGAIVLCAAAVSACRDEPGVPDALVDGAPATVSTVAFESVRVPVIATQVRSVSNDAPASCPDGRRAIDRVGVAGASRTIPARAPRALRACDWTAPSGWCGVAFTRLRDGRPLDPRLSMTCRDAERRPVGFLWISPGPGTAFVVVAGDGYAEAYPAVRDAPVRVTTERIDSATSSATLTATEHAADGRLLRTRRIEAQVSG